MAPLYCKTVNRQQDQTWLFCLRKLTDAPPIVVEKNNVEINVAKKHSAVNICENEWQTRTGVTQPWCAFSTHQASMQDPFSILPQTETNTEKMAATQEPENDALHATAKQLWVVFKYTVWMCCSTPPNRIARVLIALWTLWKFSSRWWRLWVRPSCLVTPLRGAILSMRAQTLRVDWIKSAWPSSPPQYPCSQQDGPINLQRLPCRRILSKILILNSRYRNFSHRHAPNVHLRTFASRMLYLWKHVQCRKVGCSLGQCNRHELSFRNHRRQHHRRNNNKNTRLHQCLLLTSGNGPNLSSNIRMLRDSTRNLCWWWRRGWLVACGLVVNLLSKWSGVSDVSHHLKCNVLSMQHTTSPN